MWLQLKTYKNMCSCSGSCNCNSTTIPRGPQGVPGTNGAAATITAGSATPLAAGATPTVTNTGSSSAAVFNFGIPAGAVGNTGSPGVNAFTTLTALFIQPSPNSTEQINVVNTSWAAVDQIIFIGDSPSFTDPGGFYKVTSILTLTSMVVMRMDWTIPGVTFRTTGTAVGGVGTIVTPSGTIGPSINEISVLGFDEDIRLTSVSTPGSFQNTSSFTIPANSITSINDWIEIEYTVKIEFTDGVFSGFPQSRSFQLQISPDGYGTTTAIGAFTSFYFGVESQRTVKLKLYYGGLNGASPVNQTKLIVDTLSITNYTTTNAALNYTNMPSTATVPRSYLVRTNQAGAVTLYDGALYSWNNATSSWYGFPLSSESTLGFSSHGSSSSSLTIDPIELADDILITPRFQCYDTTDVVVTNFKITKYTS